jgi:hypothetical protein
METQSILFPEGASKVLAIVAGDQEFKALVAFADGSEGGTAAVLVRLPVTKSGVIGRAVVERLPSSLQKAYSKEGSVEDGFVLLEESGTLTFWRADGSAPRVLADGVASFLSDSAGGTGVLFRDEAGRYGVVGPGGRTWYSCWVDPRRALGHVIEGTTAYVFFEKGSLPEDENSVGRRGCRRALTAATEGVDDQGAVSHRSGVSTECRCLVMDVGEIELR